MAQTRVYNRAKDRLLHKHALAWLWKGAVNAVVAQDPQTKRYKFPQLLNDFSLSLTKAAYVCFFVAALTCCALQGCGLPEESFAYASVLAPLQAGLAAREPSVHDSGLPSGHHCGLGRVILQGVHGWQAYWNRGLGHGLERTKSGEDYTDATRRSWMRMHFFVTATLF